MVTIHKLLAKLVNWLEARFPEKVELTIHMFNDLHAELGALNQSYQLLCADKAKLEAKVKQLEENIKELNANFGITGIRSRNPLER